MLSPQTLLAGRRSLRPKGKACHPASICGLHDSHIPERSALDLEVLCRCFALVRDFVVFDNLPLIQSAEAGFFDRRDMDKHVFAASALRLDESVAFLAFLRIEPLHSRVTSSLSCF
jgi:hypothetical protein